MESDDKAVYLDTVPRTSLWVHRNGRTSAAFVTPLVNMTVWFEVLLWERIDYSMVQWSCNSSVEMNQKPMTLTKILNTDILRESNICHLLARCYTTLRNNVFIHEILLPLSVKILPWAKKTMATAVAWPVYQSSKLPLFTSWLAVPSSVQCNYKCSTLNVNCNIFLTIIKVSTIERSAWEVMLAHSKFQ